MASTFLTAAWRKLAMANYAIDPAILKPYLPLRTEIDFFEGRCYVSLVGFMFEDTRLKGFRIPFHVSFEEVNLRFYVRYNDAGVWKRGVVFVSEVVPKFALSLVANTLYGEHYETMPMKHKWVHNPDSLTVEYLWKKKSWNSFSVTTTLQSAPIAEGTEPEFITEHYWGYTKLSETKTSEYEVAHPRWEVYGTKDFKIDVNFKEMYGSDFSFLQQDRPLSVFLAEGSDIQVKKGRIIR